MGSRLTDVELTQVASFTPSNSHHETNKIAITVSHNERKLHAIVDQTGVDVVCDRPSSLLGINITWQEILDLIEGDKEIMDSEKIRYLREVEQEFANYTDPKREEDEDYYPDPDPECATPF